MGFTTGLLGGLALTTSIVYLSIATHRINRYQQAQALRQQALVLDQLVDPLPPQPPPQPRLVDAGLAETLKDKWNAQLTREVHMLQNVDWAAKRDGVLDVVGRLWAR